MRFRQLDGIRQFRTLQRNISYLVRVKESRSYEIRSSWSLPDVIFAVKKMSVLRSKKINISVRLHNQKPVQKPISGLLSNLV